MRETHKQEVEMEREREKEREKERERARERQRGRERKRVKGNEELKFSLMHYRRQRSKCGKKRVEGKKREKKNNCN